MTAHIVEFESFTEAELETLEFFPEELESIEAELYPNLESISPETVAKDLEAYFEGDVEGVGLERRGGRGRGRRGRGQTRSRSGGVGQSQQDQIRDIKANITAGNLGGRVYRNEGGHGGTKLPPASRGQHYREYQLGQARNGGAGKQRLVVLIGSNGKSVVKMYYTNNHYTTFTPIK